jgi:hypothetical protein
MGEGTMTVTLELPVALMRRVEAFAEFHRLTISEAVAELLERGLKWDAEKTLDVPTSPMKSGDTGYLGQTIRKIVKNDF